MYCLVAALALAPCLQGHAQSVDLIDIIGTSGEKVVGIPLSTRIDAYEFEPLRHGVNQSGNAFTFNPSLGTLKEASVVIDTRYDRTISPYGTFTHSNDHDTSGVSGLGNGKATIPVFVDTLFTSQPFNLINHEVNFRVDTSAYGLPSIAPATAPYWDRYGLGCETSLCLPTGSWTFAMTVSTRLSYQPKTVKEYILDHLEGTVDPRNAYNNVIELRTWDAATSSKNNNLRDAEYWFRGYLAGSPMETYEWMEQLSRLSSIAPFFYKATVALGTPFREGYLATACALLGSSCPDPNVDHLPGTGFGGTLAYRDGYKAAEQGTPIREAAANFGNNANGVLEYLNDALNPALPFWTTRVSEGGRELSAGLTTVDVVDPERTIYLDPPPARMMYWASDAIPFATLEVPVTPGQAAMAFKLSFLSFVIDIRSEQTIRFADYTDQPVDVFGLSSDDPAFAGIEHLVIGVRFQQAGLTSVLSVSAVPEPGRAPLLAFGVMLAVAAAHWIRPRYNGQSA